MLTHSILVYDLLWLIVYFSLAEGSQPFFVVKIVQDCKCDIVVS